MYKPLWLIILLSLIVSPLYSQKIASFEIEFPEHVHELYFPVSIDLDDLTFAHDSVLYLLAKDGRQTIQIPVQEVHGEKRTLHWLVQSGGAKKVNYDLMKGHRPTTNNIQVTDKDGTLNLHRGDKNLLRYQYETINPPAGIDTLYKRSGFIHPLWSPNGQVLTRIQPADHYHHYGLWNPWTHVLYEGDTVDFWNLAKGEGTVRFANLVSLTEGPVFSGYETLHEHVVFKDNGTEKVALREVQGVKVFYPENSDDYYIADLSLNMNCANDSPFKILSYRYGGFAFRATEKWDNTNSDVVSSEGKTRTNVDGSREKWILVQGSIDEENVGMVIMSHPSNYSHPEPVRVWPDGPKDHKDVFINFAPTKYNDWQLDPGKKHTLNYRILVFNGEFSPEKAREAWDLYADPPQISVIKFK